MRRFWDEAAATRTETGWTILLDGKPLRIPGAAQGVLTLGTEPLAHAIAAEWQAAGGAKGGAMSMEAVPLTRLAGTAQDRIAPDPAPVAAALAAYAESDLLCYRAGHPALLAARQAREWQPWLDWLVDTWGVRLEVAEGIMHRRQDPAALARIAAAYHAMDPSVLAALGIAVPAMGSAVLGMALAACALDAGTAYTISCLDELFQAGQWGEDEEAGRRLQQVQTDLHLAERFIRLSR